MQSVSLDQITKIILKSTCQLYIYSEKRRNLPLPTGSAVLFQFNNQYFCFSNAHVLADGNLQKTFVLIQGNKTMTFGGQYFHTTLPKSGLRNDDPLDVAFVHMTASCYEELLKQGYNFLDIDQVLTGYSVTKEDIFLVAGFPGSRLKVDYKKKTVGVIPLIFRTKLRLKDYSKIGFSGRFHFFAQYSRRKFKNDKTGQRYIAPKPHGLSGSGLWMITQTKTGTNFFLIGILSEYWENKSILVSTKLDIFIDTIKKTVAPTIPNNGVQVYFLEDIKYNEKSR